MQGLGQVLPLLLPARRVGQGEDDKLGGEVPALPVVAVQHGEGSLGQFLPGIARLNIKLSFMHCITYLKDTTLHLQIPFWKSYLYQMSMWPIKVRSDRAAEAARGASSQARR